MKAIDLLLLGGSALLVYLVLNGKGNAVAAGSVPSASGASGLFDGPTDAYPVFDWRYFGPNSGLGIVGSGPYGTIGLDEMNAR